MNNQEIKPVFVPDRVFVVRVNADTTEGRGPMLIKHVCTTKAIAERIAEKFYNYYGHGAIAQGWAEIEEMPLIDSLNQFEIEENNKLKKSALAKLTKLEKEALGL